MEDREIEHSRTIRVSMWQDDGTEYEVIARVRRTRVWLLGGWTPWQEVSVLNTADSAVTRQEDGSYRLASTGARRRTRGQLLQDFPAGE